MKKSTKYASIAVVSLTLIAATTAFAGKGHRGNVEERSDKAVMFIAKKLDLTETQKEQLASLKDQVMSARTTMQADFGTTKGDVRALIAGDSFDQGKALELITARTAAVDAMAPDLVIALGSFMDSLNAEQKAEIVEFMDSRNGHRKRMRHNH